MSIGIYNFKTSTPYKDDWVVRVRDKISLDVDVDDILQGFNLRLSCSGAVIFGTLYGIYLSKNINV